MNAKQLAEWILQPPEHIQNGAVTGGVHGHLFSAKRVVAYETGSDAGIYIEPMGTHVFTVAGMRYPSFIDAYGNITNNPEAAR